MLAYIRAGIHKSIVRIENREDPDQMLLHKHSDLGLHCLSWPFWQEVSVRKFRTFTESILEDPYRYMYH